MGVITRGHFAKALWPGVNAWWSKDYNSWNTEWDQIFMSYPSTKAYEEDVGIMGFGLAQVKDEGSPVTYEESRQSFLKRYTNVVYALGFQITREMYEDDQYALMEARSQALSRSMRITKEKVAINVLNRAFNPNFKGADGIEMCSTVHLLKGGGTFANELSSPADLSEVSLEQATIDIAGFVDDKSLEIAIMPKKLVVPRQLGYEATRILKSVLQNDTANNAVNALAQMNAIPQGHIVNHYLNDPDAWFILTDCPHGLKMMERRAIEFDTDNDTDTQNAKYLSTERYVPGWTDPRGIFGSPGA